MILALKTTHAVIFPFAIFLFDSTNHDNRFFTLITFKCSFHILQHTHIHIVFLNIKYNFGDTQCLLQTSINFGMKGSLCTAAISLNYW